MTAEFKIDRSTGSIILDNRICLRAYEEKTSVCSKVGKWLVRERDMKTGYIWSDLRSEPPRFCRRPLSSYFKLRFCLISRLVRISPPLRLA